MSFNSYGYNGLISLRKNVLDKLVDGFYEKHTVEKNGNVTDGEYLDIGPIDLDSGQRIAIYIKLARPVTNFSVNQANQTVVDIRIPLSLVAYLGIPKGSGTGERAYSWKRHIKDSLAFGLNGVSLNKQQQNGKIFLEAKISNVKPDDILLFMFWPIDAPQDASTVDGLLKVYGIPPIANQIQTEVANRVNGGLLSNLRINLPDTSAGLQELSNWDFQLLSKAAGLTYDGADIALYGPGNSGKGLLQTTGNTIPNSKGYPYNFAIHVTGSLFLDLAKKQIDFLNLYYEQGETINSIYNPYGYMVVPQSGVATFYLPHPYQPRKGSNQPVVVHQSIADKVIIVILKGALSPHCRASLTNLNRNQSISFIANEDGSAGIIINASAGDRLALKIHAIGLEKDSRVVIWKPALSLKKGSIRSDFHYYVHIKNFCDIEDEGYAEFAIVPDKSQVFAVKQIVISFDISFPWWVHVVGFLVDIFFSPFIPGFPSVIGGVIGQILIETLLLPYIEDYASQQLPKPPPPSLPVVQGPLVFFLEHVELWPSGVVFTGYAEAGEIAEYGRRLVEALPQKGSVIIGTAGNLVPFSVLFNNNNIELKTWAREYIAWDDGLEKFWSASYATLESSWNNTKQGGTFIAPIGKPATFWIKDDEAGWSKFLIELSEEPSKVYVTWIRYTPRVKPEAWIRTTTVKRTVKNTIEVYGRNFNCYRSELDLCIEARKFKRSAITRAADQEEWFITTKPVTIRLDKPWTGTTSIFLGGMLRPDIPCVLDTGTTVVWNFSKDIIHFLVDKDEKLIVQNIPGPLNLPIPFPVRIKPVCEIYDIRWKGTDAFGVKLEIEDSVWIITGEQEEGREASILDFLKVPFEAIEEFFKDKWVVNPKLPRDEIKNQILTLISTQAILDSGAINLGELLSEALSSGQARLDRLAAQKVVKMLCERFQDIKVTD